MELNEQLSLVGTEINVSPITYRCSKCDAKRCKQWRLDSDSHLVLFCAKCAKVDQGIDSEIDHLGRHRENGRNVDRIGKLVPAIPANGGLGYSIYVSRAEIKWWTGLPTYPSEKGTGVELKQEVKKPQPI